MENNQKDHCQPDQEKRLYMNYNEEYDGTEIDIVDILMIFWSKKFLIAAFVIIFALCGFGYTTLMKPYYESRTTLLFMPPVPAEMSAEMRKDPAQPQSSTSSLLPPDIYLTLATADDLLYDTINIVYGAETSGDISIPTPTGLREKMEVELNKSSEKTGATSEKLTLSVKIKDSVPERAVELLTTWGKLFIQRNSDLFTDRAGTSFTYIKDSMLSVKNDLDKTQSTLLEYQKKNPLKILSSKLETTSVIYGKAMEQYNEEMLKIAPLESRIKATRKLLSLEPEKLSLSKGMSTEAVWNFLARELTPEELKQLKNMNIDDEILNAQNSTLKAKLYSDELELATLKASTAELRKRIDSLRKDSEMTEARIAEISNQIHKMATERDILRKSYLLLADEYQVSKVANVEANDTVRIIEKPVLATEPASQGKLKILLLASLLGLFMGVTVAFLVHAVQSKKEKTAAE